MRIIKKGATSQSVYFDVLDTSSTTGGRLTGVAYNTSGLTAYYIRNGAAAVAITLATQTASGAWSSGGFAEVSSTNAPGLYRLDVPDAAFATGAESVVIGIRGAANMAVTREQVQLTAFDLQSSSVTVGTNSDKTGYSLTQTFPTNFSSMAITVGGAVTVGTNNDKTGYTASTVSDKTGYALTAAYDPAKTASQAGDAMALTSAERNSTADALLGRNLSGGSSTGRLVKEALYFLRNKWTVSGGTLTVYAPDDTTSAWTATVGTDVTANPIVSNDPA